MSMGPKLRSHLATAVVALALGGGVLLVGAALFVWSGLFDVAASSGHSPPVAWLLHFAMRRSVAFHAPKLTPPNLDDPKLILRGATHFATGCAPCHGAPGEVASPIAQRMMPVPPGLYSVGRDFTPDQLFWIVQHGVKMTAMPAWPAPQRQDEIWAMVAFLRHLPEYKTQAYRQLSGLSGGTGMLSQPPAASADTSSFDPAACARCHGGDGNGRGGAFPRLAGLSAAYIAQSLAAFRDGSRPSGFMQPVAAALTDAEINQAATYFSRQVPHPTTPAADIPAQLLKDGRAVATAPTGPGTTPG